MKKKTITVEACLVAAELNELSATYDYMNGPAPEVISDQLSKLRLRLNDLWQRMTPEEFEAYSEQCGLKSLLNGAKDKK